MKDNITKLKDAETRVTVGDSIPLIGKKCDDWHGYQKHDGKIHRVTLYSMAVITGLHGNLFSVTQALQKGFQVTS